MTIEGAKLEGDHDANFNETQQYIYTSKKGMVSVVGEFNADDQK